MRPFNAMKMAKIPFYLYFMHLLVLLATGIRIEVQGPEFPTEYGPSICSYGYCKNLPLFSHIFKHMHM